MILIEGPDGAGKTTLASHIAAKTGLFVGGTRGPDNVRARVYDALGHEVAGGIPRIYDRLYYSELVYGDILRGELSFKFSELLFIDNVLQAIMPLRIFCLPPLSYVKDHVNDDQHMPGVKDNIVEIWRRYDSVYRKLSRDYPRVHRYDFTSEGARRDLENLLTEVVKYLSNREVRAAP